MLTVTTALAVRMRVEMDVGWLEWVIRIQEDVKDERRSGIRCAFGPDD